MEADRLKGPGIGPTSATDSWGVIPASRVFSRSTGPSAPGVLRSLADTVKARRLLGHAPTHSLEQGLDESLGWYERHLA